jgi:LysR family hydrogen peroxide-inducible transcriptional activator
VTDALYRCEEVKSNKYFRIIVSEKTIEIYSLKWLIRYMSYLPTVRQLQFLLALKDEGSFQAAAQACGVTQSTLSAGIKDMETLLGQDVVDRTNRKTLLFTPLGKTLIKTGRGVIEQLSTVTKQAAQAQTPFAWPLKLGVIPTIAPYWLPHILAPVQKKFPSSSLHIHEMQSAVLVQAVQQGDVDCGILALPFPTHDLKIMALFKEEFVCAAPRTVFSDKAHVTLKDLHTQSLLLLSEGHCLRDHMLDACHLKDRNHQQNISATSLSTIIQLVAHGYGVTLLPQMVVKSGMVPKQIHTLPIVPAPGRKIALIWRANAPLEDDIMILGKTLK